VAEALATGLVDAGEVVAVATRRPGPAPAPPRSYFEARSGVAIHWLAGGGPTDARPSADEEDLERLFEEIVADFEPDVVHLLDLDRGAAGAVRAARRHGSVTVVDVEDLEELPPELEHAIQPSAEVAAQGSSATPGGVRRHVVPGCALVEPTVASAGPRSTPAERGSLNLAAICELGASAGLEAVLDSLRRAGLGPVELTVLGRVVDHRLARTLRAAAEAVPGLVLRLFGTFEPRELPGLLADVDCVLVPFGAIEDYRGRNAPRPGLRRCGGIGQRRWVSRPGDAPIRRSELRPAQPRGARRGLAADRRGPGLPLEAARSCPEDSAARARGAHPRGTGGVRRCARRRSLTRRASRLRAFRGRRR